LPSSWNTWTWIGDEPTSPVWQCWFDTVPKYGAALNGAWAPLQSAALAMVTVRPVPLDVAGALILTLELVTYEAIVVPALIPSPVTGLPTSVELNDPPEVRVRVVLPATMVTIGAVPVTLLG
jgi:hypothetical protein